MDIGRIDKDDYPQILQGRKLPSSGFICEIRVQVMVNLFSVESNYKMI